MSHILLNLKKKGEHIFLVLVKSNYKMLILNLNKVECITWIVFLFTVLSLFKNILIRLETIYEIDLEE